ncbi:glucuronate isomerase [Foetidibacter luteolus]|uniref:glucuronate isomerase n=1 Tax=Foetidibacter luteolus TaxID=2608880 RepID=UPI00129B2EFC|nr:glucuronate isomerase [Foetidibacter luteolus]
MKNFLDDNFLLQTPTAQKLYFDYARQMPIIDYHNHLPPAEIAGNKKFINLTDAWLRGDHYKWRAMRTLGVNEEYITGEAGDEEKFLKWAAIVPYTVRNPLFHWTHLELKNPFGITQLLNASSAKYVYDKAGELLQQPGFTTQGLLKHFKVEFAGTTDDPCDDLAYHRQLKEQGFEVKVMPSFRPDKSWNVTGGDAYLAYIKNLSAASAVNIVCIDTLLEALRKRLDYFHELGARISDHGLQKVPAVLDLPAGAAEEYKKLLRGDAVDASPWAEALQGHLMVELFKMYHEKGWAQQLHIGALRNNSTRMFRRLGPDTGFDSIADDRQAAALSMLLNRLDSTNQLAKTVLYNVNPGLNEVLAAMTGNFNDGSIKGKIQFGSGWWFLDQLDGMEKQMNALSGMGIISCFVGMLTDSRSFLSFPRHEYFRRLLCNMFGNEIEQGLLPNDVTWMGGIIQDICYNNAKEYFGV